MDDHVGVDNKVPNFVAQLKSSPTCFIGGVSHTPKPTTHPSRMHAAPVGWAACLLYGFAIGCGMRDITTSIRKPFSTHSTGQFTIHRSPNQADIWSSWARPGMDNGRLTSCGLEVYCYGRKTLGLPPPAETVENLNAVLKAACVDNGT